jgi:hypothetical protein
MASTSLAPGKEPDAVTRSPRRLPTLARALLALVLLAAVAVAPPPLAGAHGQAAVLSAVEDHPHSHDGDEAAAHEGHGHDHGPGGHGHEPGDLAASAQVRPPEARALRRLGGARRRTSRAPPTPRRPPRPQDR